ncbi:MAG: hypothetical protein JWO11_4394 [Nocardioides sp.]|nr:hypothetical protein [Nocardioides sp.]
MFCGGPGPMTKEHAWPQWLGRAAEVEPLQHSLTSGFSRTADDALSELPNQAVHKQGSVLTSRIREVCAACNNGWMSRLEVRVRPLLERLWAPAYPLGSSWFNTSELTLLSSWATKTAWVRERVADRTNTADSDVRQAFAQSLLPPELTAVWVARHQGDYDFAAFHTSIEVTHRDQDWSTGERRSVRLCSLVFHGLVFLVRTDSGTGVPAFALPEESWLQLWPHRHPMPWPPSRTVTDDESYLVTKALQNWLTLPATAQFHRSGDWQHRSQN